MSFRADFPLYRNHPDLIYLDTAATVQKPQSVLDAVQTFLTQDYANVHRGVYDLSQRAEEVFWQSRKTVARRMGCRDDEVVFTPGTTLGMNMLAQSMVRSQWITSDSVIALSPAEHHANIVPWQMAAEQAGATIVWIAIDSQGAIDYDSIDDLIQDAAVSLVALHACSNVTGTKVDLARVRQCIGEDVLLVVDASQSIVHYPLDMKTSRPDFVLRTGHKIGAYTGCGVLYGKKMRLDELKPGWGGGGAIESVTTLGHTYQGSPDKFEPGTPNLIGAVSIAAALGYLESIGGYEAIQAHEEPLVVYGLEQSEVLDVHGLHVLGSRDPAHRIGIFSYGSEIHNLHTLGQQLAVYDICVRTGGQCTHLLHHHIGQQGSLRMSARITTPKEQLIDAYTTLFSHLTK